MWTLIMFIFVTVSFFFQLLFLLQQYLQWLFLLILFNCIHLSVEIKLVLKSTGLKRTAFFFFFWIEHVIVVIFSSKFFLLRIFIKFKNQLRTTELQFWEKKSRTTQPYSKNRGTFEKKQCITTVYSFSVLRKNDF